MKYITISDNAEVGITDDRDDDDALLVLNPNQAKELLIQLTTAMRETDII